MGKSHLQGHQEALLNFGPSTYASYNSWRSNLTHLFYAWGSKVIFFSQKISAIKENLQTDSCRPGSTYMTCIIIMSISSITSFKPKNNVLNFPLTQGWTIRKHIGGEGGGAKYKKKYPRKGKSNEKKIHGWQLTLKNIRATA